MESIAVLTEMRMVEGFEVLSTNAPSCSCGAKYLSGVFLFFALKLAGLSRQNSFPRSRLRNTRKPSPCSTRAVTAPSQLRISGL